MVNENFKSDVSDEEYHFSETENATAAAFSETDSKKNILERIQRKNVIIAILVIVALVGVYELVDILFTSNTPAKVKPIQQPIKNQELVNPIQTIPTNTAPVPQQVAAVVNEKLNTLNKIEVKSEAGIEKLSTQIVDLQNTVANLEARLSMLANSIQDLVNYQQQEAAKKEAAAKQKVIVKKSRVIPKPIYFLKAAVPGRAWLATQNGGTITVGQGDNLAGYGTIVAIDPVQGTVTTNSGAIIGYSPSDS